jgi:hypothetical protein
MFCFVLYCIVIGKVLRGARLQWSQPAAARAHEV